MPEFVGDVESAIRAALRKALPIARTLRPAAPLADWNSLTVGAAGEDAEPTA